MKKIIDGKVYDTEKAEKITGFRRRRETSLLSGWYSRVGAELYKTKKGNWFELVGTDPADAKIELNALSENKAKEIISIADPDLYLTMFSDVEDA